MDSRARERCFVRKQIRLEDVSYSDPSSIYFATLCARDKRNVFLDPVLANQVMESLRWCRGHDWVRVYAHCLMPDHMHLALSPIEETLPISEAIGRFKSYTTKSGWKLGYSGQLWQRSWYDHIARGDEDVLAICQYILENPVRKQLVDAVESWPYSGMSDPLPLG